MTGETIWGIVTTIVICILIRDIAKLTERVERLERKSPAHHGPAKGE